MSFMRERAMTGLVITHHLDLLREVDRVVVLKDGRLRESGRFEDLASDSSGLFYSLWTAAKHVGRD